LHGEEAMHEKNGTATTNAVQDLMFSQMTTRLLFEQATSYAYAYMDGIRDRAVIPTDDAINDLDVFDEPLPEQPCDSTEILRLLHGLEWETRHSSQRMLLGNHRDRY
jgi:hypothetical protein